MMEETNETGTMAEQWARECSDLFRDKFAPLGSQGCRVLPMCVVDMDAVEGESPDFGCVIPGVTLVFDESMFSIDGITDQALEMIATVVGNLMAERGNMKSRLDKLTRTSDFDKLRAGDPEELEKVIPQFMNIVGEELDTVDREAIARELIEDLKEEGRKGNLKFGKGDRF